MLKTERDVESRVYRESGLEEQNFRQTWIFCCFLGWGECDTCVETARPSIVILSINPSIDLKFVALLQSRIASISVFVAIIIRYDCLYLRQMEWDSEIHGNRNILKLYESNQCEICRPMRLQC